MPRAHSSFILPPSSLRHRGYSFTEVMFAVVVLGIGFIMIAAMFPVAISQQQSTQQETNAAALARAAASVFEASATSTLLPVTGTAAAPSRPRVFSIRDPQAAASANLTGENLWDALKGNLVDVGDRRYGVVMFYRRVGNPADPTTWSRQAQLIVVVTQVRNRSEYDNSDVYASTPPTAPAGYNLQGRPVEVDIGPSGAGSIATFTNGEIDSLAEGTYVIIADDSITGVNAGVMNGRIYQVGAKLDTPANTWELAPGGDFTPYDPDGSGTAPIINGLSGARAFIVGRNPVAGGAAYEGGAQDVAVYTTFVQVR